MLRALISLVSLAVPGPQHPVAPAAAVQDVPSDAIADALDQVRATKAESRWRLVPWMHSLSKGLARARKEGKPVFYFGYDGTLDDGNS